MRRSHATATQFRAKDGNYVTALITGGLNPRNVRNLASLMDSYGMAGDLQGSQISGSGGDRGERIAHHRRCCSRNSSPACRRRKSITRLRSAGLPGARCARRRRCSRTPHLHDRGFWKQVEHPELGRSFVYPGEAAIYNGSPWRISRRAPLIGEHNTEIFCEELGLSRGELSVLAESRRDLMVPSRLPVRPDHEKGVTDPARSSPDPD